VAVCTAIYIAGQFSWEVKEHGKRLDGHDVKLDSHGQAITRMEAWKEGYNAASNRGKD
jgi:hypothetical protein